MTDDEALKPLVAGPSSDPGPSDLMPVEVRLRQHARREKLRLSWVFQERDRRIKAATTPEELHEAYCWNKTEADRPEGWKPDPDFWPDNW